MGINKINVLKGAYLAIQKQNLERRKKLILSSSFSFLGVQLYEQSLTDFDDQCDRFLRMLQTWKNELNKKD